MKKIGLITSGGDSPGMNACIRAVVRTAISKGLCVTGFYRGYDGLIDNDYVELTAKSVSNIIHRGGTILKSARSPRFLSKEGKLLAVEHIKQHLLDGLIVIGGDGSFKGASALTDLYPIKVIGCPGTIDNDLVGTDYTIGYDTAVNTALEAIDKIRDTADSHDRVFFIEVMGRDSGYIAIQSGIAGGAEIVMVPEVLTPISEVVETLKQGWNRSKSSSIIVVAEGDEEGNAAQVAEKIKKRVEVDIDIRVTTLGHIQRGGIPTAYDRILASRLGLGAVEGLMNDLKNVMVGIVNNEIVYTPFRDTIRLPKPINEDMLRMVKILST